MSIDSRFARLEQRRAESSGQNNHLERLEADIVSFPLLDYELLASIAISLKRIADHFQKVDDRHARWLKDNEGL